MLKIRFARVTVHLRHQTLKVRNKSLELENSPGPSEGGGGGCWGCDRTPLLEVKTAGFFFFFLLFGDVRRYPYPVSGKLTLKNSKKKVSLFQDLRDFRGWQRTCKKNPHPLFKKLLTGLNSPKVMWSFYNSIYKMVHLCYISHPN